MIKDELLNKWDELTNLWINKDTKLTAFIQKWLEGDTTLSNENVEQLINTTTLQIEELKSMANQVMNEHTRICKEEAQRDLELQDAKKNVVSQFGTNPDEMLINGGILSSKASESHLIGETKTQEQLEQERQSALSKIKQQIMNKEISLGEASNLKNQVNLVYGYTNNNLDTTENIHK